ncbi:alpha-D-ribose 1-methylphosphonate 5-triphosphate synthase subunit PhnL [Geomicrobium halophilum]|uniref:Alpha-D-ribose 1-methylphosphonate 5-triphosphate synthase subunit PhnL n=1 Tax=Geomicrobium halophilum TaxID=549000 RepID=A0A841PRX3_9BACL|nr:ATP-binding cassette domain-containing protein [Geomicrobium halophilum]MBB6449916.1 alpha-D-ribose 1-methylphosphonate 5-triphosphate synthase subunit PhnL [Geomicrobium halophilum]
MLKVEGLYKRFSISNGKTIAPIQDLHFSLEPSTSIGIAGPSGIGKSSILKCLHRTYLCTQGNIWYDSMLYGWINLAEASERQIIEIRTYEVSYVSQFLRVIPRVSCLDIVAGELFPMIENMEAARIQAKDILQRLGIPEKLWTLYPATFSGGEKQRINLAKSLIKKPRLLLLDEPTASLDENMKEKVVELLLEMKKEGTAMIGVFHDWETMDVIVDHVLDMTPSTASQ